MSISVKWDITYKCNLNCSHCLNGEWLHNIEGEADFKDVDKIIHNLKRNGVGYVHLLGGEPTARGDILDIFSLFASSKLNFGFNTNGLKFTDTKFREEIVKNESLKNIVFSLEGPTAELNDLIRGKKVFSVTVENLSQIVELKKELSREDLVLTVNTVVSKVNYTHIIEMIHFCIELGVDELVLLQFIPEGNGKVNNLSLSCDETIWLINEIANEYEKIKNKIKLSPKFAWPLTKKYAEVVLGKEFPETMSMCGAGDSFFYINNEGILFPCDRYKEQILKKNEKDIVNLKNYEFWDIAERDGFDEIFKMCEGKQHYPFIDPCGKCEFLRKTCYPCVVQFKKNTKHSICKKMMEEIERVSSK